MWAVAHLKRCVYGTRDAGMIWEETYATVLVNMGFKRGIASPCWFHHPGGHLSLVVHGDDFTCLGSLEDIRWYEDQMRQAFEIKIKGTLSEAKGCDREVRVLNRVVRLDEEGSLTKQPPAMSN